MSAGGAAGDRLSRGRPRAVGVKGSCTYVCMYVCTYVLM